MKSYILPALVVLMYTVVSPASSGYCPSHYTSYGTYRQGFSCPRSYDSSDEIYCCGSSYNKYCCRYYGGTINVGPILGGVFGIIVFIIVVSVIICCFCSTCPHFRGRTAGQIISTGNTVTTTTTTISPQAAYPATGMVMQQPAANYPVTQGAPGYYNVGPVVYPGGPTTYPGGPAPYPAGQTTPAAGPPAYDNNAYNPGYDTSVPEKAPPSSTTGNVYEPLKH